MIRFIALGTFCLALTACSPFIDSRREAGQAAPVGQSQKDRPAVCYNPLWTSEAAVQGLADSVCADTAKHAVLDDTQYFNCRLLAPNTAFFRCE